MKVSTASWVQTLGSSPAWPAATAFSRWAKAGSLIATHFPYSRIGGQKIAAQPAIQVMRPPTNPACPTTCL